MSLLADELNRSHKLVMDRDRITAAEAAATFEGFRTVLVCGPEVSVSPTLQAAVLTAANLANRVRPGSVTIASHLDSALLLPWPANTLFEAVRQLVPKIVFATVPNDTDSQIVFGSCADCTDGLQVTFDGWVAAVGPIRTLSRLNERERCIVTGVAAGALAVSEIFMRTFQVTVEAGTRSIGFSLWRPDLPWMSEDAVGPSIEYLPNELWSLGLGHLGQAYLWCLGLLPYDSPEKVNIVLQDFDRTGRANIGTCAFATCDDIRLHKTRVCRRWLEARGFQPVVFERAFDEQTKCKRDEPALALCGFDGTGPRHLLDDAGFRMVVECGLGGRFDNFDSILVHTLPRATVRSTDFWKPMSELSVDPLIQSLMKDHPAYAVPDGKCGEVQLELASRSVAVPFVGAFAGSLVVAETLRMSHGGACFEKIDVRLSSPKSVATTQAQQSYAQRGTKLNFGLKRQSGRFNPAM